MFVFSGNVYVTMQITFLMGKRPPIDVFHTRDQSHVTAVGAPYWRSSFATATVPGVDVLSKLAANLVKSNI